MGSTFWRSLILKSTRFEAADSKDVNRTARAHEYVKTSDFFSHSHAVPRDNV
jgi:hypothetical protein